MQVFGLSGCGWLLLLLAGMPIVVGCGKETDDPRTLEEFEQHFAETYCQSIAACCSTQGFATSGCQTTLREQLGAEAQPFATNPKIQFNPDAGEACIQAYATALQACIDRSSNAAIDRACELVFQGTVALGGACERSAECAPQAHGSVSCADHVCELGQRPVSVFTAPHRQLGEACAGSCQSSGRDPSCGGSASGADPELGGCWLEDGLVCENDVCIRAPQAGEACTFYGDCVNAAHCVNRVCAANQSSGPCTQDRDCLAPTVCDYTLKTCQPLKANGEPCQTSDECQGRQCYQGVCRTWSVAETNTCLGVLDD